MNLTTGINPNLNVSAALHAYVFIQTWTKILKKLGFVSVPFTRQENTMIQTCSVACYSIALGGGLGSYLLGMDKKTYELAGVGTAGNTSNNFSLTYVGTGMICPHIVNISLLLGAIVSWGVMWPLIAKLKGEWFPAPVFISIALLLGDGLYNFAKILYFTLYSVHDRFKRKNIRPDISAAEVRQDKKVEDVKYDKAFVREKIPMWIGGVGYIALGIIAVIMIPLIFHELKWYWVMIAYLFAPSLAFCNAYGSGLTDINMAYNYGKVGLFMMAALAGKEHGVIAGLAGCGLIKSVVNISCYGTALGCVIGPLCFFLFYNAFDIGNPNGEFKAPYALIYRNMSILSVQGVSALPQHCLQLCYGFFAFAVAINLVKDLSPDKIGKCMPLPMAMAVPFLIGGYFGIDMCIGSLVVFVWHKLNSNKAKVMVPAVASGLICGEGLWILPSSILALAKVTPPICMKFLAS
ncbi:unnamed protein product [Withania somnifera]